MTLGSAGEPCEIEVSRLEPPCATWTGVSGKAGTLRYEQSGGERKLNIIVKH
jgi:hypothetical protein